MAPEPQVLQGDRSAQSLLTELERSPPDTREWLCARGLVLKRDRDSCAALMELGGELCFAKWYRARGIWNGLLQRAAFGRPLRSQQAARQLLSVGIRVPEPRGCLLLGDGVLTLSEGIPDSENLQNRWLAAERDDTRRSWLLAAAETLAGLHRAGYSHGDCKWSNLLLQGSQCYLVDLDAVRRSAAAARYQARDLARFTLNAEEESLAQAEYDLFLETYCAGLGLPRDRIITPMLPQLRKLRGRHRSRYGKRGQPLC